MLQMSYLNSVVVIAFDSKCLELSIPVSNPNSAFDAGGYCGILMHCTDICIALTYTNSQPFEREIFSKRAFHLECWLYV